MIIQNIPNIFIQNASAIDLFVYDFEMADNAFRSKVNLSMHMFSFLQKGRKQVHFANASIAVNSQQSLLIKKGNCLWSELLENEEVYYCKLLFFSDAKLRNFLKKNSQIQPCNEETPAYFIIENDDYISSYLDSLSAINKTRTELKTNLLSVKFEELMCYLIAKYGAKFEKYLQSLIAPEASNFKEVVDKNKYTNLKIEEIAFLCHMSLSTFKRKFIKEYKTTPGKWFQDKRLIRAKEILEEGKLKPSDIYLDFGYNNLSNFSTAFKNKFGKSPKIISGRFS